MLTMFSVWLKILYFSKHFLDYVNDEKFIVEWLIEYQKDHDLTVILNRQKRNGFNMFRDIRAIIQKYLCIQTSLIFCLCL
jgi:hypothetical protein